MYYKGNCEEWRERERRIMAMHKLARRITGKNSHEWTRTKENYIWNVACEWNRKHEDMEIFMCEYQTEGSEFVDGFMIEDDYFIVEE